MPLVQGEVDGVRLTAGSWAQGPEAPALFQVLLWENATDEVKSVAFHFSAAAGLSRAAYGQLTEGGPIPSPLQNRAFAGRQRAPSSSRTGHSPASCGAGSGAMPPAAGGKG